MTTVRRASGARLALALFALLFWLAGGDGARATVVIGGNGAVTVDNFRGVEGGGGCACETGLLGSPTQEPPRIGWPPSLRNRSARLLTSHRRHRVVARRVGPPRTRMAEAPSAPETPEVSAPEATVPDAVSPAETPPAEAPDNANRTMGDLIETLPTPPSGNGTGSETSSSRPERHARRARKAEPAPEVELPTLTPAPPQPERTAQAPQAEWQAPAKPAAELAQPAETRAPERPAKTPPQATTQAQKPSSNRVAALNPPSAPVETRNPYSAVSLAFGAGSDALSAQATQMLTHFARRVTDTQDRIEIRAYAAAPGDDFGTARRLSLKRALAVRGVLMREGIRSTRMDVRALGGSQSGGDPDRVDLALERGNAYRPPSGGPESGG